MALTLGVRFQPSQNPAEIGEAAAECERAGFDAVWMTDTPLLAGRWGDPYVCLALIASRTERLKFGTAVTNPYMRHFPAVAGACASLHDLSGGRFILGLGAGASAARELGFPLGKLKQLRELTSALRRLFREGACEFDGRPKEFNPPRAVPVYIAAMGPKTIEFAGAEGDGVILQVGANRKTLTWAMNLLRTGAEKAGRDVSEIDVVVSAQCAVDQDRKAAIRRVRHLIGIYFGVGSLALAADLCRPKAMEELRCQPKAKARRTSNLVPVWHSWYLVPTIKWMEFSIFPTSPPKTLGGFP